MPTRFSSPTVHVKKLRSYPTFDFIWRVVIVLMGDLAGSISVNNFLVPAHILSGGLTGIAQILHHYFIFLPIGTLYFLFNIPLFLLGYRFLGRRFVVLTAIGIVGFSLATDLIHLHFRTPHHDLLLMSLYGGVLGGISSALAIRVGGSMGGTDILSVVFYRLTGRNVSSTGLVMNVIVLLLSVTVFGTEAGMYTLVSMFATARVIAALMHHQQRKTALIVTSKANEMAAAINSRLTRGSTLMRAEGTYSNAELGVLMCVLTVIEIADLKILVQQMDESAFMTVLDTTEVLGQFRHIID
ncbi:MAG: YitT family protein [Alicyclobacillaceae bacterium]|nr:YitT family protein [Alicyclobacillaceae bacterium]